MPPATKTLEYWDLAAASEEDIWREIEECFVACFMNGLRRGVVVVKLLVEDNEESISINAAAVMVSDGNILFPVFLSS